ncbi:MAG TPA: PEP-CTERM sorting domain-containing protein [Steroidobacteraceae bacterium]|nr:PEP-CTERM sorting domain-containing protein [Steroidobacteraceae bacterium]
MRRTSQKILLTVIGSAALGLSGIGAEARGVAVDFEGAFDNNGNDFTFGQSFVLDRQNNASCEPVCSPINLGFDVNFGTGTESGVYINENGILSFGTPLPGFNLPFSGAANLSDLGVPVIAAYYTDLSTAVYVRPTGNPTLGDGELFYSTGAADPHADSLGAYSHAESESAFRITWNAVGSEFGAISTQIYLYAFTGAGSVLGDFDLRYSYGSEGTPDLSSGPLSGFVLGANSLQSSGPYVTSQDYYFCFRGGALANCGGTTTVVPEPSTLALMGGVLLALPLVRWFRRRRSFKSGQ